MAFGYYSPVTVNAAQVPSAQTNFPMLVSYTDARLKTVGNGGHVQNANGYDIRPYDGIGGSAMTFELERYNASTGEVIMWVLVPSCDVGSIVYLYYGDATISTNGSSTSTWDSNFKRVLHLPNGTTLGALDSTSNADNGTITTPTAATGQIDGGGLFNSTTDYISFSGTPLTAGQPFSLSWWEKVTADTNNFPSRLCIPMNGSSDRLLIVGNKNGAFNTPFFWGRSAGATVMRALGGASLASNIGTWRKVLITGSDPRSMTAADWKIYLNGSAGTVDAFGAFAAITTNRFGYDGTSNGGDATFDELRISDGLQRSADWELTEYNNQSAPSTFATLGAEVSLLNQTNFFRMFN